ncbi:glutamate synthase [Planoprotostelium fungivorum]|uniref:glutamate synthase (NADH) n=1 Tax=Planoprotostelium fungivorum TaxID=1890364 RepID=A0A2P6N1S5_9EUKA|nr:glutamate synthase [Planoprotostelium fungivorum]
MLSSIQMHAPRVIYEYFRQLFAQVTNPPIDPLREELIMSLQCYVGPGGNLLELQPDLQCAKLSLPSPMLSSIQMHAVHNVHLYDPQWRSCSIDITFPREEGEEGYVKALDRICRESQNSVKEGYRIIVLSDRNTSFQRVPLSTLVACGAVHHHLVDLKQRLKVVLVVETAEAREVHHMCVLLGYGADAICPYLVHDLIGKLHRDNAVPALNMSAEQMIYNYSDACDHGILKVMSKMGISTLQSYKGAQIFEALGLDDTVVKRCFKGTATRIRGSTFYTLARDALAFHEYGYPTLEDQSIEPTNTPDKTAYNLREAGEYHYRIGGESHMNTPGGVVNLQDAVRTKNIESYRAYSREMQEQTNKCALRGMLDIAYEKRDPIPVEEVEDWTSIVKRFVTGAMSYGSISEEAHSALAIAMNRIGTKSNTGEGGEDSETSVRGGDSRRSSTKQVASGRFGVTGYYLTNAEELQIKLAQGAKPGEGGELPGHKVSESIAKTRKSTAGVGLISPPPHHDIYSIEDLKQLIYDLKCSNPRARISVKLVSEVGIGVISAGVAKAKAEHILISGHDGGTGAARWTGIKHAGLPWELGLAETHQTLVLNNLRNKVVLQTDGQIRTGLDVAVACLLGAEEWGFATTPLIALGCIMMRKCHLNTCPVGVATQDPELRKKFVGQPEHVINFFYYVAEELRDIMAKLGFRKITDMVGRSDLLKFRGDEKNPKMSNIDFTKMLHLTPFQFSAKIPQNFNLDLRIENQWMDEMMKAVDGDEHVRIEAKVSNTDRTLGATISSKIHAKFREEGMTKGSIHIKCNGSAGQSFGAFLAKGVTLELEGDANDYVGKGLSGGRVIIFPPKTSKFIAEENIIVGNVCFYGATSGRAYVRGIAAERFAVRNSGAEALVEGVGDHGCEYMTGGRVIILGKCGRNFGAGMSGGIAYVWDPEGTFPRQVNRDLVQLETMEDPEEIDYVKKFLEEHHQLTGSEVAGRLLAEWTKTLGQFVVVMPRDYKAVMEKQKKQKQVPQAGEIKELSNGHPKAHSNGHSNGNSNGIPPKNQIQKDTAEKIADLEDIVTDEEVAKKQLDKIRGFMKYKHKHDKYRRAKERSEDWKEISYRIDERELKTQTARCMDCGIPFCQSDYGCPIANIIPSWNELVFQNKWKEAYERLVLTNNFPEFTGRVCPAPCEGACVLGLIEKSVAIKSIECAIIDKAFDMGWVVPSIPKVRNGLRIAIIGSGPAGLAAADQLNRGGYRVTVFERSDRPGGLLTYGIPEMKLEKRVVDRRIDVMKGEGIEFRCNANVGHNVDALQLLSEYDSLLLATGATWPRDLDIPGRNSKGIHFAMDYLHQNTFSLLNSQLKDENFIDAKGKHVIVIGGGDTGNDCIGTAVRHGAASVINFDYHERLPEERGEDNAWPQWPRIFRVEYGHAEVVEKYSRDPREFCAKTKSFVVDESGHVTGINTVQVEWYRDENRKWRQREKAGTDRHWKADLVLLAMGYSGPETKILEDLAVKIDRPTGNAPTALARTPQTSYATNVPKVYAAGDCRRGQSLVVWGIREGREAAREMDENLTGSSLLPVTGGARATLYKKRAVAQ